MDRSTVEKIAKLGRLELPEADVDKVAKQLSDILGHVEKLKELDTSAIEATSHAVEVPNPLREDEPVVSKAIEAVLEIAPERDENFFLVPKVIT